MSFEGVGCERIFSEALEVLAHHEDLGDFEVVVAAEVDDLTVFGVGLSLVTEGGVVLGFIGEHALERTEFSGQCEAEVAVDLRGVFAFRVVDAAFVERVLDRGLEAGEARRLVGDHVVVAVGRGEAEDVAVTAVEGVADGEGGVKVAGGGTDRTHAAEGELAEVAGERQGGLAVEEAVVAEAAVVGVEAVFKLEAHGHAVAKIFGTLDAEAGRGGDAALKSEGVGLRRNAVGFDLGMLVEEAVVDDAVKRDFRGGGKACGKAENRKGGHGLLEHENAPDGLSRSRRREQHWNVGLNSNASHSHCASVITNRGEWLPMTFRSNRTVVRKRQCDPFSLREKVCRQSFSLKTAMMWTRDRGIGTRSEYRKHGICESLFRCKRATRWRFRRAANGGA